MAHHLTAAVLPLALVLLPASVHAAHYELLGHGDCRDDHDHLYERWYIPDWRTTGLIYNGEDGLQSCACRDCEKVCDSYQPCVGYQYYCCKWGARCIGGGAVLFSAGSRPLVPPPGNFSVRGPYGSNTSGGEMIGTGPIDDSGDYEIPPKFCFRKEQEQKAPALKAAAAAPVVLAAEAAGTAREVVRTDPRVLQAPSGFAHVGEGVCCSQPHCGARAAAPLGFYDSDGPTLLTDNAAQCGPVHGGCGKNITIFDICREMPECLAVSIVGNPGEIHRCQLQLSSPAACRAVCDPAEGYPSCRASQVGPYKCGSWIGDCDSQVPGIKAYGFSAGADPTLHGTGHQRQCYRKVPPAQQSLRGSTPPPSAP